MKTFLRWIWRNRWIWFACFVIWRGAVDLFRGELWWAVYASVVVIAAVGLDLRREKKAELEQHEENGAPKL